MTDRVSEVYNEQLYNRRVQQDLRNRIHWMCTQARGQKVLDVGCSQGILSILLAREGYQVVGIDTDPEAIKFAEKDKAKESPDTQGRLEFRNVSIFDCTFEAGSFDTVVLGEVVEHVVNPERLVELAASWTKPDGVIVVTTPFGILEDPDHKRTYLLRNFMQLVEPWLVAQKLQIIGKRICLAAGPRKDRQVGGQTLDLLDLSEGAFLDAEKAYISEIRELQEKNQAFAGERDAATGQLKAAREELAKQKKEIQTAREIHSKAEAEWTKKLTGLDNERKQLLKQVQDQKTALARAEESLAQAKKQVGEQNKKIEELQAQQQRQQNTIAQRESRIMQLQQELSALGDLKEEKKRNEALLAQKDRFIEHQRHELAKAQKQSIVNYQQAQQHLKSVRYQLGYALIRAARPSKDTLLLPLRIASLFKQGIQDKLRKRVPRIPPAKVDTPARAAGAAAGNNADQSTRGEVLDASLGRIPRHQVKPVLEMLNWRQPESPADVRVQAVMDEFTTRCFDPECTIIQPRPDNWESVAVYEHPQILFVESAWQGNSGAWQYRVAKYANPPGQELKEMVAWFKREGLPTVFWNKEDPVHYDQFLGSARLFDVIFTTDQNRIGQYQKAVGHDRVAALPFAAQPRLHNPIALPEKRKDRVCFAGSYYANRFSERRAEMEMLLDAAIPFDLDIYDRNFGLTGPGADDFKFPGRFHPHIRGRLTYTQTLKAYKNYRVFLNVNSVIDSPTMFSRRVFELLACGTPVVSTPSRGIEELLGTGAVWMVKNAGEAKEAIEALRTDDREWTRRSLAGIRQVFGGHTYRRRFGEVLRMSGIDAPLGEDPKVMLVARIAEPAELDRVQQSFLRQSYQNAHLVVLCSGEIKGSAADDARILVKNRNGNPAEILEQIADELKPGLAGILSPRCVYGRHFLEDLVHALEYSGADIVGKATTREAESRFHQKLHPAGSLFGIGTMQSCNFAVGDLLGAGDPSEWMGAGARTYALDRYNFIPDFAAWKSPDDVSRARADCEI